MELIGSVASGFIYYVSLKGVTGAATLDVNSVSDKVAQIRQHTDLPLGVGFGISDAAAAASVSKCADAVVVGSAIVKKMVVKSPDSDQQKADLTATIIKDITGVLNPMRQAMDLAMDSAT